jgi:hypothetical protein
VSRAGRVETVSPSRWQQGLTLSLVDLLGVIWTLPLPGAGQARVAASSRAIPALFRFPLEHEPGPNGIGAEWVGGVGLLDRRRAEGAEGLELNITLGAKPVHGQYMACTRPVHGVGMPCTRLEHGLSTYCTRLGHGLSMATPKRGYFVNRRGNVRCG